VAHPAPDVLALVALGEDVDRAAIEHIATCQTCFDEIEAFHQVVAVGRSLGPDDRLVAPHPRVWYRITEEIADGRVIPLPGTVLPGPTPVVPPARDEPLPLGGLAGAQDGRKGAEPSEVRDVTRLRHRRRSAVALAAAAALVVGLGGGFVIRGLLDPGPDVVAAAELNALPRWPGANGSVSVEKAADGQRTLVVTVDMPGAADHRGTLEVWMSDTRATDMVPMGRMSGLSGRFPVPATIDLDTHPVVDVSLEPTDDTDPAHSDVSVVRGRLKL